MIRTIITLGAGQFGWEVSGFLNTGYMELVGLGDDGSSLHHLNRTEKQERGFLVDVLIPSMSQAVCLEPDYTITGVTDPARFEQLKNQAIHSGFHGKSILLWDPYEWFDIRSAILKQLAKRPHCQKIPGHIAKLRVYKGDTAWKPSALFPDRRLCLFDIPEGFDPWGIGKEKALRCSWVRKGELSDISETVVLNRLPFPQNAVIRKGYFPGATQGLGDESYTLASLDTDLRALLLSRLGYFYPRLSPGGITLLHGCSNERLQGARQVAEDYKKCRHPPVLAPLRDLHGSTVIM